MSLLRMDIIPPVWWLVKKSIEEVLQVVVRVVSQVALDLLGRRLQEVARGEAGYGSNQVRGDGDDDEAFEQRRPGGLAGNPGR